MGIDSSKKVSGIKQMKAKAVHRKPRAQTKTKLAFPSGRPPPIGPNGVPAPLRVDNGSLTCIRCMRGKKFKHGHHPTCNGSDKYNGPEFLRLRKRSKKQEARPLTTEEGLLRITKMRHADVTNFVTGLTYQSKLRASALHRQSYADAVQFSSLPTFKLPKDWEQPEFWHHLSYPGKVDYYNILRMNHYATAAANVTGAAAAGAAVATNNTGTTNNTGPADNTGAAAAGAAVATNNTGTTNNTGPADNTGAAAAGAAVATNNTGAANSTGATNNTGAANSTGATNNMGAAAAGVAVATNNAGATNNTGPADNTGVTNNAGAADNTGTTNYVGSAALTLGFPPEWLLGCPDNLRKVVDAYVADPSNHSGNDKVPIGAVALLRHINSLMPKMKDDSTELLGGDLNKQKARWYQHHFPRGTQSITIPRQSLDVAPSPFYNTLVGRKIYIVRWELNSPGVDLCCQEEGCGGKLCRLRTRIGKHSAVTPIVQLGKPDLATGMTYKCETCSSTLNALDGKLLNSLPHDDRESYPVDPRYANGNVHLSKTVSELLEAEMVTDGSGDAMFRKILAVQTRTWKDEALSYAAVHKRLQSDPLAWPKFDSYLSATPPAPELLRNRYAAAKQSKLTFDGQSDDLRNTIAIQNVECNGGSIAQDHTFSPLDNYANMKGKAIWDAGTGKGHVASIVVVPSTKSEDYAHAAEQMLSRPNFNPAVEYHDTYPNGSKLWEELSPEMQLRLGALHFIMRIPETFNSNHPDYGQACRAVSNAVWEVSREDEIKVEAALRNGTMNGVRHTMEMINALKDSSKWWRRYGKYIRRWPRSKAEIDEELDKVWIRYKVDASPGEAPGQGRVVKGRKLFTSDSKQAFALGKVTSAFVQDHLPREEMYLEVNLSSNSKHGLTIKKSQRPESKLEAFHDYLKNCANVGMREELADSINLQGVAQHNASISENLRVGELPPEDIAQIPHHMRGVPLVVDELEKKYVNDMLAEAGIPPLFNGVKEMREDNGERFFMQYFREQQKRSQLVPKHPASSRCQCTSCAGKPLLHPVENDTATAVAMNNAATAAVPNAAAMPALVPRPAAAAMATPQMPVVAGMVAANDTAAAAVATKNGATAAVPNNVAVPTLVPGTAPAAMATLQMPMNSQPLWYNPMDGKYYQHKMPWFYGAI